MIQEARQAWISSSDGALRPPTVPGMFLDACVPIHREMLTATYRGPRDCCAPGASPTCWFEIAETGGGVKTKLRPLDPLGNANHAEGRPP